MSTSYQSLHCLKLEKQSSKHGCRNSANIKKRKETDEGKNLGSWNNKLITFSKSAMSPTSRRVEANPSAPWKKKSNRGSFGAEAGVFDHRT